MHAVETPPAANSVEQDFQYAFNTIRHLATEHGEQINTMDAATASGLSAAHQRASLTVLLSPEERHRHTLMVRVYDRVAHAYRVMEQRTNHKQR